MSHTYAVKLEAGAVRLYLCALGDEERIDSPEGLRAALRYAMRHEPLGNTRYLSSGESRVVDSVIRAKELRQEEERAAEEDHLWQAAVENTLHEEPLQGGYTAVTDLSSWRARRGR